MKRKLNLRQKAFCFHYLANGLNGTQAAISAGYSTHTAREIARENLTKPDIQNEISKMQDNLAKTAGVTSLMIARQHMNIAFSDITSLHNTWISRKAIEELTAEQRACIQEVSTKVTKVNIGTKDAPIIVDVEYIKIKVYDKQRALDALSNLLGFNAPVKNEITGKDGKDLFPTPDFSKLTDDELKNFHALYAKMEKEREPVYGYNKEMQK